MQSSATPIDLTHPRKFWMSELLQHCIHILCGGSTKLQLHSFAYFFVSLEEVHASRSMFCCPTNDTE